MHILPRSLVLLLGNLSQTLLQSLNGLVEIVPLRVSDRHAHVAETDVLGSDLLVQAAGEDDTPADELGQNLRRGQTLGQPNGGHAVGGVLGLCGDLLETELGDGVLHLLAGLLVHSEAVFQRDAEDLGERGVKGVDELGRGCGEVGGLLGFVVLHDRQPVLPADVVASRGSAAGLEALDGALAGHEDAETGGHADGFLGGGQDDVDAPVVELDVLAADGADAVDDDKGVG